MSKIPYKSCDWFCQNLGQRKCYKNVANDFHLTYDEVYFCLRRIYLTSKIRFRKCNRRKSTNTNIENSWRLDFKKGNVSLEYHFRDFLQLNLTGIKATFDVGPHDLWEQLELCPPPSFLLLFPNLFFLVILKRDLYILGSQKLNCCRSQIFDAVA